MECVIASINIFVYAELLHFSTQKSPDLALDGVWIVTGVIQVCVLVVNFLRLFANGTLNRMVRYLNIAHLNIQTAQKLQQTGESVFKRAANSWATDTFNKLSDHVTFFSRGKQIPNR